jgi:hypothetical protein
MSFSKFFFWRAASSIAMFIPPGYHVFSVLVTDAQGNLRTSNPAMLVVRKTPTDAAQQ